MCFSEQHVNWLVDTGERLCTADGKEIEIWEFQHEEDEEILSAWARHFRNHYCLDTEIDWRKGRDRRADFLKKYIFPDPKSRLGPSTRAGDFGEILVADYLEYRLGYWVPRFRWMLKPTRNESTKGCDVIGFKIEQTGSSSDDTLYVIEVKTKFSKGGGNSLQNAINDSEKDDIRIAESLNFLRQKMIYHGDSHNAKQIERFQSPEDHPYQNKYGASFIVSSEYFDDQKISQSNCQEIKKSKKSKESTPHRHRKNLVLLVIRGANMMKLVHELYRRAADEA